MITENYNITETWQNMTATRSSILSVLYNELHRDG